MSSKKARRRKLQEAERQRARGKPKAGLVFILAVVLALLAMVTGALVFGEKSTPPGDPPWPGAVWSPSHGHWH